MPWLDPSARARLPGVVGPRPARHEAAAPQVPAVVQTASSPDALVVVEGIEFELLRLNVAAWVPSPAGSLAGDSTQASSRCSGEAAPGQTSTPNSSVASLDSEALSSRGSHVSHHAQLASAYAEPVARGRATLVTTAALRGRWRRPSESAAATTTGHHAREHSAPASRRTDPCVPLPPRQPTVASGHHVPAALQPMQTRISVSGGTEPPTAPRPAAAHEDERARALGTNLLRAGHGARLRRGWGTPSLSQPTPPPSIVVTPPMLPSSWAAPTNPSPSYVPPPRGPLHPAAPRAVPCGAGQRSVAAAAQSTHPGPLEFSSELQAARTATYLAVGELTAALHGVRRLPPPQAVAKLRTQARAYNLLEQRMRDTWPELPRTPALLAQFEDDALAAIDLWRDLLATASPLLAYASASATPRVYVERTATLPRGGRGLRLHVDDACFAVPQPELHRLLEAARHRLLGVAHALQALDDEVPDDTADKCLTPSPPLAIRRPSQGA